MTAPARRAQLVDPAGAQPVSALIAELKAGVERAHERSLADETRDTYDESWTDYLDFVKELRAQGEPAPVLPEEPGDVRYLGTLAMWLVFCLTQRRVIGRGGSTRAGLAWSTVQTRLSGVIYHYLAVGVPNPRDNVAFRNILRGLARDHATGPEPVTALTSSLLKDVLDNTRNPSPEALRDRVAVLLLHAEVPRTRLTKLDWSEVDTGFDRGRWQFGRGRHALEIPPRRGTLCPATALRDWWRWQGQPCAGPVFPSVTTSGELRRRDDGSVVAMSKQGLLARLRRHLVAARIPVPGGLRLPSLADGSIVSTVLAEISRDPLVDVRDRAVLLIGLTAGSRRRNLAEFTCGSVKVIDEGLDVTFGREKNNALGRRRPRVASIDRVGGPYCPVEATEVWLARYRDALGRPRCDDDPLFPRLHSSGALDLVDGQPQAMTREAFADIVERRAEAAELLGRFRSHSLRRGLATTLARAGASLPEIARRGGWRSLDVVWGYIEEAQRFEGAYATLLGLNDGNG